MNDDDLYYNVLKFLAENGIHEYVDVFDVFNTYQNKPDNIADTNGVGHRSRFLNEFLGVMKKSKYIDFNTYTYDGPKIDAFNWMDRFEIKATITPKGLNFYQKLKINKAQITNFGRTLVWTIVSSAAIIASAIYAVITYYKDDPQNLILIRKSMQQQEQIMRNNQKSQKGIDTSLRIMAKKNK